MKYNRPKLKFWTLGLLVLMLSLETRAEIHLSEDTALDEKAVKDTLAKHKISVESVKKVEL